MSLINDALRRAREAERDAPPPPSPQMQFRPVEPAQHPRHGLGLIVPAALAVVALLALLFIWQLARERMAIEPREVQAPTPPAAQPKIAPQPTVPPPEVVAAATQPSPPPPQPSPQTASATGVTNPLAVTATTTPASPPEAKEQENEVAIPVAITRPPEPESPPLKLQAIAFNPKQPCVVINGTILFVGEKLGDLRVVAIDRKSATLVGVGRTNILTMP
jgi:cytoskeletal protein RodZ